MNHEEARRWLDNAWNLVLSSGLAEPDTKIDRLVDSDVQSIRYAVLTQILGKIADRSRGVLSLQLGDGEDPGAWDPRSFCSLVVVPWVSENCDVLGNSTDPYVSNPLRRLRLDDRMHQLKYREEWQALIDFLAPLDSAGQQKLESVFMLCLKSVARRLARQAFKYRIPKRISLPKMLRMLEKFLAGGTGGLRPLAVSAAMMTVLGRAFSIFSKVVSQGVNVPDASTGAPGDIMCWDDKGNMALAVEVKERSLTLNDFRGSVRKAKESADPLSNLLFSAKSIRSDERAEINREAEVAWAAGFNANQIDIVTLAKASFSLLSEEWRPQLLREIGEELDRRADHAHRIAWHEILKNMDK